MKKKKSWAQIKASKPPEEWKKRSKIYNLRYEMKSALKQRGVDLMNKIQKAVPIGQKGMRDSLIQEISMAIRLERGWLQPDYDHAVIMLDAVEAKYDKLVRRKIPPNSPLTNTLLMVMDIASGTEKEKAMALEQVIEHNAQMMATENAEDLENNLVNFLVTLVRKPDGHYPKWFVDRLCETITGMLLDDDLKRLQEKLTNYIKDDAFLKNGLGKIFAFEEEDENEDEI